MESLHNLNVERLERVASRLDKVHTGVDTVVDDVYAIDLVLGIKVGIETLLDIVDNRAPRLIVVDKVSETRGIDDSETQTDPVLFELGGNGLDSDGLRNNVVRRTLPLLGWIQGSVE